MFELEWWQFLGGILGVFGFSAAPWIAALLTNKLLTIGVHRERMEDKNREIARLDTQLVASNTATAIQQKRADDAIATVVTLTNELGQTAIKLIDSLPSPEEAGTT